MVDGADDDGVQIVFLFEQFAKVGVRRAPAVLIRTLLGGVVRVDDSLTRLSSRDAGRGLHRMRQLNRIVRAQPLPSGVDAEQPPDRRAELAGLILRMAAAAFVRIAHGHALDVRLAQEVDHHAQSLRPDADEGDVDLRARRDLSGSAQHAAGDDGQRGGRAGNAEKLTSLHGILESEV